MKKNKQKNSELPETPEKDAVESAPESGTIAGADEQEKISEADELKKLSEEYLDRYLRTLAEFDNFRKRTQREKAVMYDDGVRDAALKFLPVMDNFILALAARGNPEDGFYKGMEMILKQMNDVLAGLEITEINAVGQPFDPNLHDAVMHVEDETLGEGVVAEELRKGYTFRGKTIRHSMVKVAN